MQILRDLIRFLPMSLSRRQTIDKVGQLFGAWFTLG